MKALAVAVLVMTPIVGLGQEAPDANVDLTLRRMQQMIHQAVEMAAQGARLVAVADPAQPSAVDGLAVDRGRKIIADARDLIREVAAGDAMMQLHAIELTDAQNAAMIRTHQLEQAATRYVDVTVQLLFGNAESGDAAPPAH